MIVEHLLNASTRSRLTSLIARLFLIIALNAQSSLIPIRILIPIQSHLYPICFAHFLIPLFMLEKLFYMLRMDYMYRSSFMVSSIHVVGQGG